MVFDVSWLLGERWPVRGKKKKRNEVANMQAVFPGAQVCVKYNQHVVPFADSPPL